ncbi:hypothetical protein P692DRAFT_20733241, partial [Suillus brevipes Sb2]
TMFDPKGFLVQAQSSERENIINHSWGLRVVAGEELYCLCKHQKCEYRKGNKQSLQAYSGMSLYTRSVPALQMPSD